MLRKVYKSCHSYPILLFCLATHALLQSFSPVSFLSAGSPQTVAVTGIGTDFSIAPAAGSSTTATVTAGQTATYTLAFAGTQGFNGTVALSCAGAPQLATCSVTPASVSLNGTSAVKATVSVSTTAGSMLGPGTLLPPPMVSTPPLKVLGRRLGLLLLLWFLGLGLMRGLTSSARANSAEFVHLNLCGSSFGNLGKATQSLGNKTLRYTLTRWRLAAGLLLVLLAAGLSMPACGGGGGTVHTPGTPSGTYTLTVTATYTSGSMNLSHTQKLTLTVQ